MSQNIFRKQQISIQVYDDNIVDGDIVHVYLNGKLVRANVPLLKYPGITIPLTLQASASLPTKVNKLTLLAAYGGTAFTEVFKVTPGISIATANAGSIVRGGPKLDVYPKAINIMDLPPVFFDSVTVGRYSDAANIGLELVCYDPFSVAQKQSTKHAIDALAGVPDTKGRVHKNRIVTIDRLGTNARRYLSTKGYPKITGNDNDEYPPAIFKENNGSAHVRSILLNDNRSFGGYLGSVLSGTNALSPLYPLYKNGDQVELTVAPRSLVKGYPLYCKNAW
ncbi:NucA/NucB deoxyribonuclease domain-containing protein [Methyloglobulus sp.]|uniref:NucA/NucB deoxyribonuclease domain-containing protein n=1 Tax=Methyloglobulus sp. TaxID=2518622 RepID=UPI0032B70818